MRLRSEPGLPVFRKAGLTVYRPALGGLERDFAFLMTICTDDLGHFPGPTIGSWAAIIWWCHLFYLGKVEKMKLLSVPGLPVFRKAGITVNRSPLGRFERDFALLTTIWTDGLRHFPGLIIRSWAAIISRFHCCYLLQSVNLLVYIRVHSIRGYVEIRAI